jgi:hypothetical protein
VEAGLAVVTGRMLSLMPAEQAAALAEDPVTIDPDTTDVGVYGRKKRGVAYNHQGQRVGRAHVATWAEAEIVLAADLGDGTEDPRATAPGLLRRALACLPAAARAGRLALRGDAGYFAGQLARAAHEEKIAFAIGASGPCRSLNWAIPGRSTPTRHRTTVENIFRDSKLGAALRHLPSGYPQVNLAWMGRALLAANVAAWLHQLTGTTVGVDILAGHGVRGGKAMIATLRWRLIAVPGRLIRLARQDHSRRQGSAHRAIHGIGQRQ